MKNKLNDIEIRNEIIIDSFITIDYYNLNKDFYQLPDSHDYWELVYCDKGDVISNYDGIGHTLSSGQVVFHPPHSMHSHISNKKSDNSILVISFSSNSQILDTLKKKTFYITNQSARILSMFLDECKAIFDDVTNVSTGIPNTLEPKVHYKGYTQVLACYFIEFLYSVIRNKQYEDMKRDEKSYNVASCSFTELIKSYLNDNIYETITLEYLCRKFNISKSNLCKKWKEQSDTGIIDYFLTLKIKEAKKLMRQNKYSITQIADMLSYSSIHHFSHSFKKDTGMSPKEYKDSIQTS